MVITKEIRYLIKRALHEDIGRVDVTTLFTIPMHFKARAVVLAKEEGILCGIDIMKAVFKERDNRISFKALKKDGDKFSKGARIAYLKGPARNILAAERVSLNFLSMLSGISTLTGRFVAKIKNSKAKLLDTRKTTPTLRDIEKYAVRCGGGTSHRRALEDTILVKDNHLRAGRYISGNKLDRELLAKCLGYLRKIHRKIEIEVETLEEFTSVIRHKPNIIMLDNFKLNDTKKAVIYRNKHFPKVLLEASGGIKLETIAAIAKTGVDFISTGYITHSAQAIDFSIEVIG